MLAALNAVPGMRVCEIGTGTGYNAALLAARLGAPNITTIEIDPQLADQARQALAATGYGIVTVVTGDGAHGYPPATPYDRIIATCAVREVPYPWIAQTRAGGQVLTPWGTAYLNSGLLSLTVREDGTAQGGIVGDASVRECVCDEDNALVSDTNIHPYQIAGDRDAAFAIGLRVPACKTIYSPAKDDSGEYTVWFLDQVSRSWASIDYSPGVDTYPVRQWGPRHLWDEVAAAYRCWMEAGRPKAEQWRFTVTPEGQHIEFVPKGGTNGQATRVSQARAKIRVTAASAPWSATATPAGARRSTRQSTGSRTTGRRAGEDRRHRAPPGRIP